MCISTLVIGLLATAAVIVLGKVSDELMVPLGNGAGVTGHYRTSHSGRGILAFTNIPYAESPVGELRFEDPVQKKPWSGYLPSNQENIHCPQMQTFSRLNETSGTEDCLYLNVYVPQSPRQTHRLAVMVFLHGGGFTTGSGSLDQFDPEFILEEDVILVTLNYRLGVFGFLATFDETFGGNWGLKDQQMALKWVQENIRAFGGDNEKITIFGMSAGGASVGLHLMAPQSKGLFQRAILQSGTPFDAWVLQDKTRAVRNANKLFKLVGCDKVRGKPKKLFACMQQVSSDDIMATTYQFFEWDVDPITSFGPILEPSDARRPFIREMDAKLVHDVPIMIGVSTDEGAFKSALLNDQPELIADLEENFDEILPSILYYSHYDAEIRRQITSKIREFYFPSEPHKFNWESDKHTYTKILSDGMFVSGFDKFLQIRIPEAQSLTFVYQFNYNGESSFTEVIKDQEKKVDWGVSHGEDLLYLFPIIKTRASHRIMTEKDHIFRETFVRLLTDFAAHNDPAYSHDELLWMPFTKNYFDYLIIGNCNRESCPPGEETAMSMNKNLFAERRKFWRQVESISKETVIKREKRDEL